MTNNNLNFAYFGTSEFAVKILEKLIENGYVPSLVVTAPDKPKGRKMIMTPPPVKVFAQKHNLKIIQPEKLKPELFITSHLDIEYPSGFDLFIVASYGKIIPKSILDIPKFGTLNVHPSLLPKFRGPSPIQSFILSGEEKTGATIMLMDEQVDHGPILAQRKLEFSISNFQFPKPSAKQLEEKLAELGGEMLIDAIPKWINGEIKAIEQNHDQATFTKKITKEDGLVDLEKNSPEIIYRKFLAFQPWPGIYYFVSKNNQPLSPEASASQGKIRVIITDMELKDGLLLIKKVKPESKNEMEYEKFMKS